jgi:D-ornithine 4,5-aminomutase subunit alpha
MTDDRITRFEERQQELHKLTDAELKDRFWQLCDQLVDPIVELARTHTSPSIERSVLLRMGIDSITAHGVVDRVLEAGLLGKGAGHVVLKVAKKLRVDIPTAARGILEDKDVLNGLF